ncbi:FAD-dependent oxidoreductase [Kribbella sp. NPDC048915]|uniref:NAD(P)/FAD-dependent oxidoreductase n=1 Tax=Kribbella sp. NPDC048915 TaxID=3155148 RepID=UPI0033FF5961
MRIAVVGSGVIGLLTAVECVRATGVSQVDLVDAGPIPSPTATSHDRLRVVRALHRGEPALTFAAAGAHTGWLEVESLVGSRFYHPVGALTAMPQQDLSAALTLLTAIGARAWALSPTELAARYPKIRFPEGSGAVLEATAGVVLADQALAAVAHWLGTRPQVRLHPHRRVVDVTNEGVHFDDGTSLSADRVVVAAGPWSRALVPPTIADELTLWRQSLLSYRPDGWAGLPAVLGLGPAKDAWMMPKPAHSDAPLRLSAASACRPVDEMTDRTTPARWREHLERLFAEVLPDFDPAAVIGCVDGYYLADRTNDGPLLLSNGAVWTYAACGGMSFKFAPQIARTIADHALGRTPRPSGIAAIDTPRIISGTAPVRAGKE